MSHELALSDVMHDAVKGIKENRKFRKNQDHRIISLPNYKIAIAQHYKYPPLLLHFGASKKERKKEVLERESERKKEVRKFWWSWKQYRSSEVLLLR